jgi:D-alanyl-D-alanine carboxypeptidase
MRPSVWPDVAALTTGEPVPWGAHVRIGSDTKTITAVVALQLVGEGVLDLDDTVEDWLPGLVRGNGNDGSRITLTNLLRHTSGLHDYVSVGLDVEDFTYEHYRQTRFEVRNPAESVARAFTEEPGWLPDADDPSAETTWGYSNTNYVLAQLIIEEATGNSWEQEVHERIIEPLGLRRTYAPGTSAYVPEPTARAYLQFPGDEELYDTTLAAAKLVFSGVAERFPRISWVLSHLGGAIPYLAERLDRDDLRVLAPDVLADERLRMDELHLFDFGRWGVRYGVMPELSHQLFLPRVR